MLETVQAAEAGGEFQYSRPFREQEQEHSTIYPVLEEVLEDKEGSSHTLQFLPGTLSVFSGWRCLHQVEILSLFLLSTLPLTARSPQSWAPPPGWWQSSVTPPHREPPTLLRFNILLSCLIVFDIVRYLYSVLVR